MQNILDQLFYLNIKFNYKSKCEIEKKNIIYFNMKNLFFSWDMWLYVD